MARDAQNREDLLRDATAFAPRLQLRVFGGAKSEEVFVGFRRHGAASFYFDQDPVFHFNNSRQLRRAFFKGVLMKAERGELVMLRPVRSEAVVSMIRHTMSVDEQQNFCQLVARQLQQLRQAIGEGNCAVVGHVGTTEDPTEDPAEAATETSTQTIVARLAEYLDQLDKIVVAASPRVGG